MSRKIQHLLRLALENKEVETAELVDPVVENENETAEDEIGDEQPESSVVELIQAKHDVDQVQDHLDQVQDAQDEVSDLKDAAEVVNANGGISAEAFKFFDLSLQNLYRRLGMRPSVRLPTLESFKEGGRIQIAIEELDEIADRLTDGADKLKSNGKGALLKLVEALSVSLPESHKKLERLIDRLNRTTDSTEDTSGMEVVFGDGLNVALSVNGEVPECLSTYIGQYVQLGQNLLGDYQRTAMNNALRATGLPDLFTYSDVDAFNNTIEEAVCSMEDPRLHLTAEQKALALPGTEALFRVESASNEDTGEAVDVGLKEGEQANENTSSVNPKLEWLKNFSNCCQVNSQIANPCNVEIVEAGQPGYGRVPLSNEQILDGSRALNKLFKTIRFEELSERQSALAKDSFETVDQLYARYKSAEEKIRNEINEPFECLVAFVETVFKLAHWPSLNYLTNLVLTTNAFVLYAERSIALPEGKVEAAAAEVSETAETEEASVDKVVEPTETNDAETPAEGESDEQKKEEAPDASDETETPPTENAE